MEPRQQAALTMLLAAAVLTLLLALDYHSGEFGPITVARVGQVIMILLIVARAIYLFVRSKGDG